ncbi:hypothetical protein C0Q70_16594 [Pomacea canaliculata]|uniref:Uncharacterized protein n=1 Tax=Pomacea canaliculata TaxID=400727 RepID=A0A2T7NQA0_POMCA|nr:hypothetical protein C0Q70_16594 [Pomacea canaliculata]
MKGRKGKGQDWKIRARGVKPNQAFPDRGPDCESEKMASECSICLHTFNRPKLLPCFHTFCEGCLASIVSQASQAQSPATDTCFPCPLCRTLTDVPQAGVCAFLDNIYIKADGDIQTQFAACDTCRGGTKARDPLEAAAATSKCVECNKFLCHNCLEVHNQLLRTHTLVSVTAGRFTVTHKAFCHRHPDEELRFFCLKCQTPVCRDCRMTSHAEGHTSVDLKDVSQKAQEAVSKVIRVISDELIPAHESMMVVLAADLKCKQISANNIKELISRRIEELHKGLEEVKEQALKTVEDAVAGLEEATRIHHDRLARLKSQRDYIKQVLSGGCEAHILLAAESVKTTFSQKVLPQPPLDCCQTVVYDRSDDVHIKEIPKTRYLSLNHWKSFAAGFAGKARVMHEHQSVALSSYSASVSASLHQVAEALRGCDKTIQAAIILDKADNDIVRMSVDSAWSTQRLTSFYGDDRD